MATRTEPDPSQRSLVADVERLVAAARAASPSAPVPCFAHLRLHTRDRVRDYLLGTRTVTAPGVTVFNWQTAPLAEAFFACPEGSDYEIAVGGRTLTGTVLARSLLEFEGDALVGLVGHGARLARDADGRWGVEGDVDAEPLRPSADARAKPASAVEVLLDDDQRRAVERPPGGALLVLGEAGAGKTTVALHRLANLQRRRPDAPLKAVVVVPTEGLRRLSEALLARLDVADVEVALYDRWAGRLAKRAFLDIPVRESEDATAGVILLKRHRALAQVLAAYATQGPRKGGKARVKREDLHHLFGDKVWMDRVVEASRGEVPARVVPTVLDHTRVQFSDTTESAYSHVVDAERLQAVDGRSLDAGTPMNDAGTVDVEDYAVLFELDRVRALARGEGTPQLPRRYDVVVVDEAQELSPLELALVGRAVAQGGTLVVAGDAGQQVDTTACFTDWATTMRDLGATRHEVAQLHTVYRCPAVVTELARHILDPEHPLPPFEGAEAVRFLRAANECHLVTRLVDGLRALTTAAPGASVAVITRTPESAKRLSALLGRGVDVRLALDGDFHFGPGVNVTAVQEVKGLEFDYVVVPDATSSVYPDSGEARRALYVAVTRTIHQVLFATTSTWTSLVGRVGG